MWAWVAATGVGRVGVQAPHPHGRVEQQGPEGPVLAGSWDAPARLGDRELGLLLCRPTPPHPQPPQGPDQTSPEGQAPSPPGLASEGARPQLHPLPARGPAGATEAASPPPVPGNQLLAAPRGQSSPLYLELAGTGPGLRTAPLMRTPPRRGVGCQDTGWRGTPISLRARGPQEERCCGPSTPAQCSRHHRPTLSKKHSFS